MFLKNEKGFTGVDISISIVVLFIFVSIIAMLSYNYNSSAKEIELKAEATSIAVQEIEQMKLIDFSEIENISIANGNNEYVPTQEVEGNTGFFKRILIEDYADNNPDKISGLVKTITVQVKYMFKGKEQTVELSTILSKES